MTSEVDSQTTKAVIRFLQNIIETKRILRECNGIIDSNIILKLFKSAIQNDDSGFESEPVSVLEYNTPRYVPAIELTEIIFEKSDLDKKLKEYLIHMCKFIRTLNPDLKEDQTETRETIDFTIKFVEFLAEDMSNVPFREIIQNFLESMFKNALADNKKNSLLNFVLKLFQEFGKVKELQGDILEILIQNLLTFAKSVKYEDLDALASFHYELDFNRANTLLLTLLIIKKEHDWQFSQQNLDDFYTIFEIFSTLDNFFSLAFLCKKIVSDDLLKND